MGGSHDLLGDPERQRFLTFVFLPFFIFMTAALPSYQSICRSRFWFLFSPLVLGQNR